MATSLKGQTNGLDLIRLELRGILWPWISWLRYVVHRTCYSLLSSTSKLPCLEWSIWTWKFIDWDWMGSWSKWGCILSGTLKSETFFTPEILFVSEALWRLCLLAICFAEQLPDDECSSETCGLELHQLRAQKEESKLVVKKDDDHITSNTSFTGSCSADDETLMNKFWRWQCRWHISKDYRQLRTFCLLLLERLQQRKDGQLHCLPDRFKLRLRRMLCLQWPVWLWPLQDPMLVWFLVFQLMLELLWGWQQGFESMRWRSNSLGVQVLIATGFLVVFCFSQWWERTLRHSFQGRTKESYPTRRVH